MNTVPPNYIYGYARKGTPTVCDKLFRQYAGRDLCLKIATIAGNEMLYGKNEAFVVAFKNARDVFALFNALTAFDRLYECFAKIIILFKSIIGWNQPNHDDGAVIEGAPVCIKTYQPSNQPSKGATKPDPGTTYVGSKEKMIGLTEAIARLVSTFCYIFGFGICGPINFADKNYYVSRDVKAIGQVASHIFAVSRVSTLVGDFFELAGMLTIYPREKAEAEARMIKGDQNVQIPQPPDTTRIFLSITKTGLEMVGEDLRLISPSLQHPLLSLICAVGAAGCAATSLLRSNS